MRKHLLLGLAGLMLLPCLAHAAVLVAPPPTIWNSATPVAADGWMTIDRPYALVRNRLMVCEGPIETPASGEPVCHAPGTTYTKPTMFEGGHPIPGPVQSFMTLQQYLDSVAARNPSWHQKLTFSAIAVSRSNLGSEQLWVFYQVSDAPVRN